MSVKLATCACVLLLAACDPPLCGTYDFTLPETKAAFANQPELITQPHAGEWCSEKYGTQGRWDPQAVEILFGPMSSATSSASYSDLLLSVKLQPSLAVVGTPVSFDQMVGTALLGLGESAHRDESRLTAGSLTFKAIGELLVEDVLDRRVVDAQWDLTWSNGKGSVFHAVGRDTMDLYSNK